MPEPTAGDFEDTRPGQAIITTGTCKVHEEEFKALARHDKPKAIEHMFNRFLWLKVHEIMQRLDPPATDDETVEHMLSRARDAGDADAQLLLTDSGREDVIQEARDFVEKLLAGGEDRSIEDYINDA